ncbi:MAG: hypothetical protein ACM3S5_20340 [Rhodospirillales bacterium]
MLEQPNSQEPGSDRLSELFAEYRAVLPDPEPSATFSPGLWEKIDARRSFAYSLRRLARGLITAAAAVCMLMGFYLTRPEPSYYTYLEVLAAEQPPDGLADAEIVLAVHDRNP